MPLREGAPEGTVNALIEQRLTNFAKQARAYRLSAERPPHWGA